MDAKTLGESPAGAFSATHGIHDACTGINLRQHFAGLAMQACISNEWIAEIHGLDAHDVALAAVDYADALLAELSKDQK